MTSQHKKSNMAGAQFEYDDKGTTFYYFVLCFCAIVLLPLTYFAWVLHSANGKSKLLVY